MAKTRELLPGDTVPVLHPGDTLRLKRANDEDDEYRRLRGDEAGRPRRWRVDDAGRWSSEDVKSRPALMLSGVHGTQGAPVKIEADGDVFLSGGSEFELWRHWSNKVAHQIWQKHWAEGSVKERRTYPGVHEKAGKQEHAVVYLRGCSQVVLDGLDLRGAYPTLLLLKDCSDIVVRNTSFSAGTFAISIRGGSDVTIERCRWRQDGWLWRVIAWNRVHYEGIIGEVVDVSSDFRNFDGSFINAEGMTGSLVVRLCDIGDAFNGVHLFNRTTTTKLIVTDCRFTRIRDNAVEIEDNVEHVTIAHNFFVDPYRPISIDTFKKIGWFYLMEM